MQVTDAYEQGVGMPSLCKREGKKHQFGLDWPVIARAISVA